MLHVNPLGRNWGSIVNWDALGKFYASLCIAWTVILVAGMAWLVRNRQLPFLKMRNIPLAISSTVLLHIYLVKVLLAYTTNGHFLCSAEFWIMSIYLPLGVALFQANMVQLLSISERQKKLLDPDRPSIRLASRHPKGLAGLWSRWNALPAVQKTYGFIGAGMICQVIITAAIYSTNAKLQGHWGKMAYAKGQALCRRGPEWIPSAFWQLFWSCLYGPYLLWKVRNIKDAHYWRLQTILCVVSGFPGTPLWLAAVFSFTKFKYVNRFWVPPMWLIPGIFVMQACTIFFPIYEAYVARAATRSTLSILEEWERKTKNWDQTTVQSSSDTTNSSTLPGSLDVEGLKGYSSVGRPTSAQSSHSLYTLSALEKTLATNPRPLQEFAATRDFTAESINFLLSVRDFKIACNAASTSGGKFTPKARRALFRRALKIYLESVCERTAEFPINIDGPIRVKLEAMFETETRKPYDGGHPFVVDPFNVTPWAVGETKEAKHPMTTFTRQISSQSLSSSSISSSTAQSETTRAEGGDLDSLAPTYETNVDDKIPDNFDGSEFNAAERSIKYLVVTNTWRKFVTVNKAQDPSFFDGLLSA